MLLTAADEDGLRALLLIDVQLEFDLAVVAVHDKVQAVRELTGLELEGELAPCIIDAPHIFGAALLAILEADGLEGLDDSVLHADRAMKIPTDLGRSPHMPALPIVPDVVPGGLINDAAFRPAAGVDHHDLSLLGRFLFRLRSRLLSRHDGHADRQQSRTQLSQKVGRPHRKPPRKQEDRLKKWPDGTIVASRVALRK